MVGKKTTKKTSKKVSKASSVPESEFDSEPGSVIAPASQSVEQIKQEAVEQYKAEQEAIKKEEEVKKAAGHEEAKKVWLDKTEEVENCNLVGMCYRESRHPGHKWVPNKKYPCYKTVVGRDKRKKDKEGKPTKIYHITIFVDYEVMTYERNELTDKEREAGYKRMVDEYTYSEKEFRRYFKLVE